MQSMGGPHDARMTIDDMPRRHAAAQGGARPARARYLVLIEQDGAMLARLFDDRLQAVEEFDAGSEEVAVMTAGLPGQPGAGDPQWDRALAGHGARERAEARVYVLDV
jgi:hypothetical protein